MHNTKKLDFFKKYCIFIINKHCKNMDKKTIKITENELHNIIKESIKRIIHETYQISSVEELMEYMWLRQK